MVRRRAVLTLRVSSLLAAAGVVLFLVLVGIAQRTTSAVWFLTFPLLLLGLLVAAAAVVLRMLRHF